MYRSATQFFMVLLSGFLISASLPYQQVMRAPSFSVNSQVARFFRQGHHSVPGIVVPNAVPTAADSASTAFKILLFNYSTYDSVYADQMRLFLQRELPGAGLTDFYDGSGDLLGRLLDHHQAVVIAYPFQGDADQLAIYGKKLDAFVRAGGVIVVSGTHGYEALHQMGLFDIDNTYYYDGGAVHIKKENHPLLSGIPTDFSVSNYIYAVDLADAGFVSLAEAEGMPVVGYKEVGIGKVIYLGLEYYDDEVMPSRLLKNAFKWALPEPQSDVPAPVAASSVQTPKFGGISRRTEEVLYTGSSQRFDLKVYPNPYLEKASVEIVLEKQTTVSVEMTSETGALVANLLPQRTLSAGYYRLDVPEMNPGIYFIKCKIGGHIETRKVVKLAQQ